MLNFAGQDIAKGDYIGQVARTSQGMKRRVGVVMGYVALDPPPKSSIRAMVPGFRVIWNAWDGASWTLEDGNVLPENVFHIESSSLGATVRSALEAAHYRGHA